MIISVHKKPVLADLIFNWTNHPRPDRLRQLRSGQILDPDINRFISNQSFDVLFFLNLVAQLLKESLSNSRQINSLLSVRHASSHSDADVEN